MAVMELWRRRDLEGTVKPEYIDGNFFTQDSVGNLVGVKCYKDGAEVALTGSVTGYCVLPSGETVSVAGTRSGNQASILVPQSALAYTGPLGITLKLIDGNTITTLMRIIVVVYRSKTDTVITPSSQIITDWANQISAALQEVEDASAAQDVKIADLKSAIANTQDGFELLENDTKTLDVDFVNKAINSDGSYGTANTKRAATEHDIFVPYGCELSITVPSGYRLNYWAFDGEGTLLTKEYNLLTKTLSGKDCVNVRVLVTTDPNTSDISTATAKSVFTAVLTYVGDLLKSVDSADIEPDVRSQLFDIGASPVWEIGGLDFASGAESETTHRLRTQQIMASQGTTVYTIDKAFSYGVFEYNRVGRLITAFDSSQWHTDTFICANPDTYTIRIVLRRTNNPEAYTMQISDGNYVVIAPILQKTPALSDLADKFFKRDAVWEIGAIAFANGSDSDSTTRIRCGLIEARKGSIVQLHDKTNYSFIVYEYMTNRSASISNIYVRSASDWQTDDYTVQSASCAFIRVCVRRNDNGTITGTTPGELVDIFAKAEVTGDLIKTAVFPASYFHTDTVQYDTVMTLQEIYAAYDALASAFPNYITKTDLGSDSSGQYHVYQYTLIPENMYDGSDSTLANSMLVVYSKDGYTYRNINHPKVLMDAAIHGNEKPITRAMLNFVYKLCYNWMDDEVLEYLRWNVQFVIIPVAVPWGYVNTMRGNYNKVNINRNFNAGGLWENGSDVIPTEESEISVTDYRGDSPLSEKETQYIYNMLRDNKDASVYINWHTVGQFTSYSRMTAVAIPTYYGNTDKYAQAGIELTKAITANGWKYHDVPTDSGYIGKVGMTSNTGTADNQAQYMGIPGVCMEGMYQVYNQPSTRDTHEVNCMNVEYITNGVLLALGHQLS